MTSTTRTILSTAMLVAITALTAHATEIEFCTGSTYDPDASCPGSQPSSGSGTCYNLTVEADTCCKTPRSSPWRFGQYPWGVDTGMWNVCR